jgi:hypothetical protein
MNAIPSVLSSYSKNRQPNHKTNMKTGNGNAPRESAHLQTRSGNRIAAGAATATSKMSRHAPRGSAQPEARSAAGIAAGVATHPVTRPTLTGNASRRRGFASCAGGKCPSPLQRTRRVRPNHCRPKLTAPAGARHPCRAGGPAKCPILPKPSTRRTAPQRQPKESTWITLIHLDSL